MSDSESYIPYLTPFDKMLDQLRYRPHTQSNQDIHLFVHVDTTTPPPPQATPVALPVPVPTPAIVPVPDVVEEISVALPSVQNTVMAQVSEKLKNVRRREGNPTVFSVIDTVQAASGYSADNASKVVRRLFAKDCDVRTKCPDVKFDGYKQIPTPACDLDTLFVVIGLCGGKTGKKFLASEAVLARRYFAGDIRQEEMDAMNSVRGNFIIDQSRRLTEQKRKRESLPQVLDPPRLETLKEKAPAYKAAMSVINEAPNMSHSDFPMFNDKLNSVICRVKSTKELKAQRTIPGEKTLVFDNEGKPHMTSNPTGRQLMTNTELNHANEGNNLLAKIVPGFGFLRGAHEVLEQQRVFAATTDRLIKEAEAVMMSRQA